MENRRTDSESARQTASFKHGIEYFWNKKLFVYNGTRTPETDKQSVKDGPIVHKQEWARIFIASRRQIS